jgi:Rhs element Vgr protein
MPPPSPAAVDSNLATFTLLVGGQELDHKYELHTLEIITGLNRIPYAQVELLDGDAAAEDFPLSASDLLKPGVTLEIQLGYESHNETVFSGIVVRQCIRQQAAGATVLQIEARDKAVRMTITRRSAIYSDPTDTAVLQKVIQKSGLTADVTSTTPALKAITQYNVTDWDFLLARTEANGLVVNVSAGTVHVLKPDLSTSPVLSVTFGDDVLDFRLEEDAQDQYKAVQCTAWDYSTQALVQAQASIGSANALGSTTSDALAQVASPDQVLYQSSAPWANDSLTAWAQGLILRSELAKVRGELTFQGSALITPGKTMSLNGFGARFNGTAFISAVSHSLEDGQWLTTVEVGLDETPFVQQVPVTGPAASGLLPGVSGLQNGVVKQIDQDPDGAVRVEVQIPVVGMDVSIWARLTMPYATNNAGICFYPEVGDEVILGFVNEDPTFPIILGCLYSAEKKAPPYPADAQNSVKSIKTKNGVEVKFDDQNKVLTLQTPGGNKLVLSDQDQGLTLTDQNNNSIKFSSSGIEITSASKVTVTAQSGVDVKASTGDVALKAAAGKFAGDALTAAFTAQSELTIKGAMVKIN